jgi:hypothetical protein
VLRRTEQWGEKERANLARLGAIHPEIEQATLLVHEWLALMRARRPEALRPWRAKAQACGIDERRRFANGVS